MKAFKALSQPQNGIRFLVIACWIIDSRDALTYVFLVRGDRRPPHCRACIQRYPCVTIATRVGARATPWQHQHMLLPARRYSVAAAHAEQHTRRRTRCKHVLPVSLQSGVFSSRSHGRLAVLSANQQLSTISQQLHSSASTACHAALVS